MKIKAKMKFKTKVKIFFQQCKTVWADRKDNYFTNQCDGCKRGLPISNGMHEEVTGQVYMSCTKRLYQ